MSSEPAMTEESAPATPLATRHQRQSVARSLYLRSKGHEPKGPNQLKFWPIGYRELPNDFARSALFSVRNKRVPRRTVQNEKIFHVGRGVTVYYTGIELRAEDDELVWQQILDYGKGLPLGEPIVFSIRQLLLDLAWPTNRTYYRKVRESIARLKANEVRVESETRGVGVALSLLMSYTFVNKDSAQAKYSVQIDPELIMLFAGNTSTRIEWVKYRRANPVARRLFDYAASHQTPYPLDLLDFHKMCGSECRSASKWRQQSSAACDALMSLGMIAWAGVLKDGKIHFDRSPQPLR